MDAVALLDKLDALGVSVAVHGDRLRLEPGSKVPPDLVEEVRRHKAEVMSRLQRPEVADAPPEWHVEEVARLVEAEGICVFWSDLFGEPVAFVKDESFKAPAGIVAYTVSEIDSLFGGDKGPGRETLRLVHEAKKLGGRVAGAERQEGQP